LHRTSAGDCGSPCEFCQAGGKRKCHCRNRLRYRHESESSHDRLGKIPSDGRRRAPGYERALGIAAPSLILPTSGEERGGGLHFSPNSLAALPPKIFSLSSAVSPSILLIADTCPASIIGVG